MIDDFAHHPTAIRLTLEAVQEAYPEQRIWAVFEPRSATCKRKVFEDRLPKSFAPANKVIIAGLFAPDKIDLKDRLDPELVVERINSDGGDAYFIPDIEDSGEQIDYRVPPKRRTTHNVLRWILRNPPKTDYSIIIERASI